jgi:hypothetical protein
MIGEGRVKTIVPITGTTADEAIAQAQTIGASAQTDMVEFRVDFLDIALDAGKLAALGPKVAAQLKGKPLIVTFRTQAEGGNKAIADADYGALYETLLKARRDVPKRGGRAPDRCRRAPSRRIRRPVEPRFLRHAAGRRTARPPAAPAGTGRRRLEAGDDAS